MRTLLFALAMTITSVYAADAPQLVYDPNSPAALEANAKYEGYTRGRSGIADERPLQGA